MFVALTLTYGTVRLNQVRQMMAGAPKIKVGMVQVNMGIFEKRSEVKEGHERHLAQSRELEKRNAPDLIVWPESAILKRLPRSLPSSAKSVVRDLKTPIIFGGLSTGDDKLYNTAFITDGSTNVVAHYDKTYLLAFGEYVPFGETFPKLYELSPESGQFTAGTRLNALPLGKWRIAALVCYEDVLPGFTRKMVRQTNPHLMINITNDAWFGDSQEPWIHLALAQFRAIEHRRYLVRSTNSGVSAFIDPTGRGHVQDGSAYTREPGRAGRHDRHNHSVRAFRAVAGLAVVALLGRPGDQASVTGSSSCFSR